MKKVLCFVLVLTLIGTMLIACSKNRGDESESTSSSVETNEQLASDLLPSKNLGGEFRILNNESNFAYTMMTCDETTSNQVEYAIYERNAAIEEKLNIIITENRVPYSEGQEIFNRLAMAGTPEYDLYFNESWIVTAQALSGFMYDLNSIDSINLNNPWWNQDALSDLTIGTMLFGLLGDFHLMANEATWVILYNQNIADNLQLGNYYEMVHDNTWTFEALFSDILVGAQNLDGEEGLKIGTSDVFGVATYHGVVIPFLKAAEQEIIGRDENNLFAYNGISEFTETIYTKITSGIFENASDKAALQWNTPGLEDDNYTVHDVFRSGNALFYMDCVGLLKKFSEMTDDYGVLPFPKYSSSQEKYISTVARYCSMGSIPIMVENPERSAEIMEYLGAYSYDYVTPAYVDTLLENRYIRDAESRDMIRLIFENRRFDIAGTYSIGSSAVGVSDGLAERVCAAASYVQPSLGNYVNEIRGKIDSDLEDILLYYGAIN